MYPKYRGFEVKPSRTADHEMVDNKIYLDDIIKVLEYGENASISKRKPGIIEKNFGLEAG